MIYQPSNTFIDRINRRIRPFISPRKINFKLDRPLISISFDDFPQSAIKNGSDLMEDYGWCGTFYTCASFAGMTNHHGLQYSAEELSQLERKGHEIACHTADHLDCTQISHQEITEQFKKNCQGLAQMGVKKNITGFAYPYGAMDYSTKKFIGEHFKAVRGIQSGVHYGSADLNELKANGLYSSTVETVLETLKKLQQRPGWYILFTHDINEQPSPWGCKTEQFKSVLASIHNINAKVLPVREAVNLLETQDVNS